MSNRYMKSGGLPVDRGRGAHTLSNGSSGPRRNFSQYMTEMQQKHYPADSLTRGLSPRAKLSRVEKAKVTRNTYKITRNTYKVTEVDKDRGTITVTGTSGTGLALRDYIPYAKFKEPLIFRCAYTEGWATLEETTKNIEERKFCEEHPELGEKCY